MELRVTCKEIICSSLRIRCFQTTQSQAAVEAQPTQEVEVLELLVALSSLTTPPSSLTGLVQLRSLTNISLLTIRSKPLAKLKTCLLPVKRSQPLTRVKLGYQILRSCLDRGLKELPRRRISPLLSTTFKVVVALPMELRLELLAREEN